MSCEFVDVSSKVKHIKPSIGFLKQFRKCGIQSRPGGERDLYFCRRVAAAPKVTCEACENAAATRLTCQYSGTTARGTAC